MKTKIFKCEKCTGVVSDSAKFCNHCGGQFDSTVVVPTKGGTYKIDWDGPSVVKVLTVDTKDVLLVRIVNGKPSTFPADKILMPINQFRKALVSKV